MVWNERIDKRNKRTKIWQDRENPKRFALDATLAVLHYESSIDSGVFDTPVDATPVRVNNPQFDGWRITENGWHYALGKDLANHGNQDGWVGFGGRKGQHWFKFRLARVGYFHWPSRVWDDIGGAPDYDRSNLSQQTDEIEFATDGSKQPIGSIATWADIWKTPGGGSLSASWRIDGDKLKEEITINQAGREWIAANKPPTTPLDETWFGFVFQLDWSDIPAVYRQGILQDIEGDFADGDESIELKDALDRLLAFMPISDVRVPIDLNSELEEHQLLRKRFYKDIDGKYYLLLGLRTDILNGMPKGDLIFDPTIDVIIPTNADDGIRFTGSTGFNSGLNIPTIGYRDQALYLHMHQWFRWTGVTLKETIDVAYGDFWVGSDDFGTDIFLKIYGVDEDNPAAPTSAAEFDADPLTVGVDWDGAWVTATWQRTPSLVPIFQELVDSYSIENEAVAIQIKNDGSAGFNFHYISHKNIGKASKLHIEYTVGDVFGPRIQVI